MLTAYLVSATACAWWDDEHQVIAIVAEKHLSISTNQQIEKLLKGKKLSDIANWADSIKSQSKWSHSKRWHYMNIDSDQKASAYHVIAGGDILWALDYFYEVLKNKKNSANKRREALKFFVHLVADIHQPLHVGRASDLGGNRVLVSWKNQTSTTNLHKVWDGLLTQNDSRPHRVAKDIDNSSAPDRALWQDATFRDWVNESVVLLENVYDFGGKKQHKKIIKLGEDYQVANRPLAEKRMLQAGVRLAHYLNIAFE